MNLVCGLASNECDYLSTLYASSVDLYGKIHPSYYLYMAAFAHRLLYAFLSTLGMKHAVYSVKKLTFRAHMYLFLIKSG